MTRYWAAAILLALATAAGAADTKSTATTTTTNKSKGPPSKVTAEQAKAVRTTKATFMSAVGSCAKPDACDPKSPSRNPELVVLLEKSEEAFMQACVQCATDKACEEERVRIRDGRGRFGYNACMQGDPKTSPPPADAKKAATPK
jgi:hypothetical protein